MSGWGKQSKNQENIDWLTILVYFDTLLRPFIAHLYCIPRTAMSA